jgi:hypothetical protein
MNEEQVTEHNPELLPKEEVKAAPAEQPKAPEVREDVEGKVSGPVTDIPA